LAKSQNMQQVVDVAELEDANTLLRAKLDTAHSKLVEVKHHERTRTSENEGLKRDLKGVNTAHEAVVKDNGLVQQAEQAKLQQFQDSIRKRLAELRCDTEASVTTLGGRSAEFPVGASLLSDFFKWFRKEIELMPTTFVECNENVTCYTLIGVFQILAGEGCEHLLELKILALSCNTLDLRDFPVETGRIDKKLVKIGGRSMVYHTVCSKLMNKTV
jgi:hypothetical protein